MATVFVTCPGGLVKDFAAAIAVIHYFREVAFSATQLESCRFCTMPEKHIEPDSKLDARLACRTS